MKIGEVKPGVFLILGVLIFVLGFVIGGIVKRRKLIGDKSEDTLLFRHELGGIFRSITPREDWQKEDVYSGCREEQK
jgi:hypothetical protein